MNVITVRFKVVDTDYSWAVVYQCHGVTDDGRCRRDCEQVDILSRNPALDELTRTRFYNLIIDRLCIDVYDLVKPARGMY